MKIFFLMTCVSALAAVLIGCSSETTQATTSQTAAATTTSTPPPTQDIRHMPVMGGMRGGY